MPKKLVDIEESEDAEHYRNLWKAQSAKKKELQKVWEKWRQSPDASYGPAVDQLILKMEEWFEEK